MVKAPTPIRDRLLPIKGNGKGETSSGGVEEIPFFRGLIKFQRRQLIEGDGRTDI